MILTDKSPIKTGVLTFHRCINYGSYWQARCLVEGLRARGLDAVILDHESRRVNLVEWKCAFRPTLPTHVPKTDYPFYRTKIEKFFRAFEKLPLSQPFALENPSEMEDFDLVVVGSDEVWNLSHPWFGGCSLFYGDNIKTKHLISYAASFGNYDASWGLEDYWANKLRNFDAVSVRDENARNIIKNSLGFDPEIVLDPCLQFPINAEDRQENFPQKPYIAVYGHNFSETFAREARRWADSHKLILVSIGYRNDWADEQWLTADPHDFTHFINRAEAVATNFFHGCVFSLRNEKPFVCEVTQYRSNKIRDLMRLVGGENHLVSEQARFSDFEAALNEPLNPEISERIERLRQTSNDFLNKSLKLTQYQSA